MNFPYYTGKAQTQRPQGPVELPKSKRRQLEDPSGYLADVGLVDAANVALLLGKPLLLTGEPGTGKTQLAYSLAWELGFPPPLKFETKSNSDATDVFYTYDTLGRFHAAQLQKDTANPVDYITYNALGAAILQANEKADVENWLPKGFAHQGAACRSVVLIDEVDKAPRDFPNDILNEVEGLYFNIPELGNVTIKANEAMSPILIFTSNSEKHLPDAFLRRCAYYHIPFPNRERLRQIITVRLGDFPTGRSPLLDDALSLFSRLRDPAGGLHKKPATAELLDWLRVLRETDKTVNNPLREKVDFVPSSLSVLVKTKEDRERAHEIWAEWSEQNR